MGRTRLAVAVLWVIAGVCGSCRAGRFYRQYWAQWDPNVSNHAGRLRVNDKRLSLHENFGRRGEARANGLMLVDVDESLFQLRGAELYLELWGGHPGTANKRFLPNGRGFYDIPEVGAEAGNCTYSYPAVELEVSHLVRGINAFQFTCDRGRSFWGHFIIDNAAVRCFLKEDHEDLVAAGLEGFSPRVTVVDQPPDLGKSVRLCLSLSPQSVGLVRSVDYFARYLGFDDDGDGIDNDWHGFTYKRSYRNHIGSSDNSPAFGVEWDTTMLPSQAEPMAVKAVVSLKEGFFYETDVFDNLRLQEDRGKVEMYKCSSLPRPFWSRAGNVKEAVIVLPEDISIIDRAQLQVKVWDGGEGDVDEPFRINGHSYCITSGRSIHDVVFTVAKVEPSHLKPGENKITLLSDTGHHGIEVLLPGPVFIVRYQ